MPTSEPDSFTAGIEGGFYFKAHHWLIIVSSKPIYIAYVRNLGSKAAPISQGIESKIFKI